MSLRYIGSISMGVAAPALGALGLDIQSNLLETIAALQARIASLLAMQLRLSINPPSIAASISFVTSLLANLQASLVTGPPSIDVSLPAIGNQLAEIAALVSAIQAKIVLTGGIMSALGAFGVHAWAWDGPAHGMGPSLAAQTANGFGDGSPSDAAFGIVFAASAPAAVAALRLIFGGMQ